MLKLELLSLTGCGDIRVVVIGLLAALHRIKQRRNYGMFSFGHPSCP